VVELVLRLARENNRWGYLRIAGQCHRPGVPVSVTSARNIVRRHRLGPAPRRGGPTWTQFLRTQAAGNLLMDLDQHANRFRLLVRDRDAKLTTAFDTVFAAAGIQTIPIPPRAPQANAYAERWVQTVRTECLDQILILNSHHLRHVLDRYLRHYNTARPHRGLNLAAPLATQPPLPADLACLRSIQRRDVLGGLIHEYRHAA
jgi:putative transposase